MAFITSPAGASSLRPEELRLHEHGAFLRSLARALTRDSALADDLVQETLAAQWSESQNSDTPSRHWLSKVLRRKAVNAWRSDTRRQDHEAQAARSAQAPSSTLAVARADAAQRLFAVVNELDAPVRDAIIARFYGGLTFKQIAKEQDAPASTIKSRVTRGLATLREQLDQNYPDGREQWLGALAAVTGTASHPLESGAAPQSGGTGLPPSAAVAQGAPWPVLLLAGSAAAAFLSMAALNSSSSSMADGKVLLPVRTPGAQIASTSAPAVAPAHLTAGITPSQIRTPALTPQSQAHDGEVRTLGGGTGSGSGAEQREGLEVRWQVLKSTALAGLGYVGDVAETVEESAGAAHLSAAGETYESGGSATTNAQGHFEFDVEPSGERIHIDIAETKTYRGASWSGTLEEWNKARPLVITRAPHGAMTGRVTDLSGKPLKGATITAKAALPGATVDTISGPDGSFKFENLGRTRSVHVRLGGYVLVGSERPQALGQGGWAPHEFVLAREGALRLTIPVGKAPLAIDRSVSAFAALTGFTRHWGGPWQTMKKVKIEGAEPVTITGLPVGRELAFFSCAPDALYTHRIGNMAVLAPRTDDDRMPPGAVPIIIPEGGVLELNVPPPYVVRVQGSVRTKDDQPMPNALVQGMAPWTDEAPPLGYTFRTRSDADGNFDVTVAFARKPLPFNVLALDPTDTGPIDYANTVFDPALTPATVLRLALRATAVDVVKEATRPRLLFGEKPKAGAPKRYSATGSIRRSGRGLDRPVYVSLMPSGGSPAILAGLTSFGRASRFVSVDPRGRFRVNAPKGSYTAWIGTRDELLDGKPSRRIEVSVTAGGLVPKVL